MNMVRAIFTSIFLSYAVVSGPAANYFVALTGDDLNAGTETSPWRTIQMAVSTTVAGDRVTVAAGNYDERISSVRGGTGETNRIVFKAEGVVTMRGFLVQHPFITVEGFRVTGHSASSVLRGYIEVTRDGDNFHLLNSTVEDGIYIIRPDLMFESATGTIRSPSGGFLAAGFKSGQTLNIEKATNTVTLLNTGTRLIQSVTDDAITVAGSLVNDGPVHAYISGSTVYGLVILGGAENCIIQGNTFRNLSYDTWFVGGANNVFENNTIQECHGWDAMHFMGTNQVFRGNFIRSSPLLVFQVSPDVFENWSAVPYSNVLFESNWVYGFSGVLAAQKGTAGSMNELTFRNNVFVDVGRFILKNPNTTFQNNTFLYVSATNSLMNSPAPHALKFEEVDVRGAIVRNNIFVGCGQGRDLGQVGWYEFDDRPLDAISSHNFVAGLPPSYDQKDGFAEGAPILNGGDPGFVDITNPLGADGLPFTADDGLRLRPNSKLRGAGYGGEDLGAYTGGSNVPVLRITHAGGNILRLSWNEADAQLQAASMIDGSWSELSVEPTLEGGDYVVTVEISTDNRFFRLML